MRGTVNSALRLLFVTLLAAALVAPASPARGPSYAKKKTPKKVVIAAIVYSNELLNDFGADACSTNPAVLAIHKGVADKVVGRLQSQGFDVVNLADGTFNCSGRSAEDLYEVSSLHAKWAREVKLPGAETTADGVGVFTLFVYADTFIDAGDRGQSSAYVTCFTVASARFDVHEAGKSRKAWANASKPCSPKVFASAGVVDSVLRGDSSLRVKKAEVQDARRTCLDKILDDALAGLPRYEPPKDDRKRD